MKFSDRILKIKPSPTMAVTSMANALKSQGIDIISLGAGEPDFDTPDNIAQVAIKAIKDGMTKYTPANGIPALRQAVADRLFKDCGAEYKAEQIVVASGAKHNIYVAGFFEFEVLAHSDCLF